MTLTLVIVFAIVFLCGVFAHKLATMRAARLHVALVDHYRDRVKRLETREYLDGGHTPPDDRKTRQRSNTAQAEASYALVEGLPDRNGDGKPDQPQPILTLLAEIYPDDDVASVAAGKFEHDGDAERPVRERIARRLAAFDGRTVVYGSSREYRAALDMLAEEIERLVAAELDVADLRAEVEALRASNRAITDDLEQAHDALVKANNSMMRQVASNSTRRDAEGVFGDRRKGEKLIVVTRSNGDAQAIRNQPTPTAVEFNEFTTDLADALQAARARSRAPRRDLWRMSLVELQSEAQRRGVTWSLTDSQADLVARLTGDNHDGHGCSIEHVEKIQAKR